MHQDTKEHRIFINSRKKQQPQPHTTNPMIYEESRRNNKLL